MSVCVVFPTANAVRARRTIAAWHDMGYRAFIRAESNLDCGADMAQVDPTYPGYWASCNSLIHHLLISDQEMRVVVVAADDIMPDAKHSADEIAGEFVRRFCDTYGVMQPTGDEWSDSQGRVIERICGSPWIGRAFIEEAIRVYGGAAGPYAPGYYHFYGDEHLQRVAAALGILWQRPDLEQEHWHWSFRARVRHDADYSQRAAYQEEKSRVWWKADKALFERNAAVEFPETQLMRPSVAPYFPDQDATVSS